LDSWVPLGILSSILLVVSLIYSSLSNNSLLTTILGMLCLILLLLKSGKAYDLIAPAFWITCLVTAASDYRKATVLTTFFVLYYPIGRIYVNFAGSHSKLDAAIRYILLALLMAIGGGMLPTILIPVFSSFPAAIEASTSLTILLILLFEFLRRSLGK